MEYDVLFLGRLFPKQISNEIKNKMLLGMQDAADALQWNIIEGLDFNNFGTIKILDMLPVGSFPRSYKDPYIDEFCFNHSDKYESGDKVVKMNNITILKQFMNGNTFKKEVKSWVRNKAKTKIVIAYTASPIFLSLIKYIKKLDKSIICVCIVADLPEYICAKENKGLLKAYVNYLARRCSRLYRHVDKFILLTKYMATRMEITSPYMIMEGIATSEDLYPDVMKEVHQKYVFYSGTLNYSFGIGVLLDAFDKLKEEDLYLVICGVGEAEAEIIKKSRNNNRIVFLGKLERYEVLSLQKNAMMLVNPRQNNEEFTKYSFPSKNLEYLSSGKPVIAYKLDGIPDEYDEYFIYPKNNTSEELANLIKKVYLMDEENRKNIGQAGKNFVRNNKNKIIQSKKIIDFLLD